MRLLLIFFLLVLPAITTAQNHFIEPHRITLAINHDDGGKTSQRHLKTLLNSLNDNGCNSIPLEANDNQVAQLRFDPSPVSFAKTANPDYRLIARAKTLSGELTVSGAIVVHASTGITDLTTLHGEWIAFISKNSWPGYHLPIQLLKKAGITEANGNSFYFVGNHVGSASALLHKDVFAAVMAEPLANHWAGPNNLAIVAVTDAVETGGWWLHKSVPNDLKTKCSHAIGQLKQSQHKALPAWIDGFVIPK